MKLLTIILLILLLTSLAFTLYSPVDRINEVRVSYRLDVLQHDLLLDRFAQYRIDKMQLPFSHAGCRSDYNYFMKLNNQPISPYIGEIIAFDTDIHNSNEYVNAWLASTSHKTVMLNSRFTDIGYATGVIDNYYIVVVIFMCQLTNVNTT